ncbi:MAG: hypothetical protein G01um101430_455 [Parcubacteria group bacterium Gr01-1014_30]|nr:MAG: hypothetical protein G01um101430_455 [Parcubacteria group bacterium Gr01-1014_30]
MLDQNNFLKPPKAGDIVEGKVIAKERGAVFLDLGPWGSGIIYGRELKEAKDTLRNLKVSDKLLAKIVELKNEQGYIELSPNQAGKELTWEQLRQKKEKGDVIQVKITGANKGGLLAEVSGIPAFLPVSQLAAANYPKVKDADSGKILKELQKFLGKELQVQVLDLAPKAGKLILSEKSKESGKIRELLKKYEVGQIVEGKITGIVEFGAFIKFGDDGLEGLIHISELDWKIIEDPLQIVKVGQKVKAKIIGISDDKVFLSLKALKKDPWEGIEDVYKKGDKVAGKVTKLNPFGAFVQIADEIQGLCHISEFGSQTLMEEKLKVDKIYNFEILEMRPAEHKMSLKLVE